jgi:hypothetical protein
MIGTRHIVRFQQYLRDEVGRWGGGNPATRRKTSPATQKHYWRVLKTWFGWLVAQGYLETCEPCYNKQKRTGGL